MPITIQNDFCLIDRRFEQDGTAEACAPKNVPPGGVSLLAYGPLAGGTLSGKYLDETCNKGESAKRWRHTQFPDFQPRYHSEKSLETAVKLKEVGEKYNIPPAQLALRWCADREYMGAVIIGATTMEQLKENVEAFDREIPEECLDEVEKLHLEFERPYFSKVARMGRAS
mmetsp:Transcript_24184/g.37993  ORF Transcript_24184/g.37993 Transcript_24184/m.37993 type:complete len:170 (-) Transcript_24184:1436-1945(-)